jgi:hypothetical protein
VGYGDAVPRTPGGKVVAAFCAISGILFLALPLTIFSFNFSNSYSELKNRKPEASGGDEVYFEPHDPLLDTVRQLEQNQEAMTKLLMQLLNERKTLSAQNLKQ